MKKLYLFTLLFSLVISGCSKDFLKSYDDRIEGDWVIVDVDRRGIGGSINNQVFKEGDRFSFAEGGVLSYTNTAGVVYDGTWNIRRDWVRGSCYTDDDGDYNCDDRYVKTLSITAVDFITQDIRSDYFDEIRFTGTNRFNAFIYDGARTYIFRFRR